MATCVLDHIVHLTPPGTVELASSEFRKLGFEVVPGGTHADGLTYNALVVLADGVYLELIAFVDADPPPSSSSSSSSEHRWGRASPGWIDFAHLGLTPDVSRVINARAARDKSGVVYEPESEGGREMPQEGGGGGRGGGGGGGRTLRWRITAPEEAKHGVGRLPFFCGDVTPREWRVPQPGNHPCTAQGISHVKLLAASKDEFTTLVAQLSTVVGRPPASTSSSASASASSSRIATWDLETPKAVSGLQLPPSSSSPSSSPPPRRATKLILEDATGLDLKRSSSGIHEVGFWVTTKDGGEANTPYGKIVWTPIPP